jgi:hypothetical protein
MRRSVAGTAHGYQQVMPDFGDIEKEAKDHSKETDEGIQDVDKEADKDLAGKDHGLVDKGSQAAEKELGSQPGGS